MTVCSTCEQPVEECMWDGKHRACRGCGELVLDVTFNGRCMDCHERSLRPVEDWSHEWTEDY